MYAYTFSNECVHGEARIECVVYRIVRSRYVGGSLTDVRLDTVGSIIGDSPEDVLEEARRMAAEDAAIREEIG